MQVDTEALRQARSLYHRPFPTPRYRGLVSSEELKQLDDLHGRLVLYEGYIDGIVVTFLKYNKISPYPLKRDPELRQQLNCIVAKGSPIAVAAASEYLNRLDAIETLVSVGAEIIR